VSTTPQLLPDLHFEAVPLQIGNQMMVRLQIADNFGITFQLVIPPQAARAFGKYLQESASTAESTIVKPPSMLAPA
jgi:hypothetical protein